MSLFSEFSLIIFSYNEGKSLLKVIENSIDLLKSISMDFEILIVNDGSSDNTDEILENFNNNKYIRIINHSKNLGIGCALKTGYENIRYKYVCAIPGDGQFDVNELKLINEFNEDSFYSYYRVEKKYSFFRNFLTCLNRLYNYYFLNINLKDVNWIKVYHLNKLGKINITLTSSLIESEICAKLIKMNVKVVEIPSKYLDRKHGVSKGGNIKTISKAIIELYSLWKLVVKFKY